MARAQKIIRLVLPPLVAAGASAIKIAAGQLGIDLVLAALAGALLGWSVAMAMDGIAVLVGTGAGGAVDTRRLLARLERDRRALLHAIKEIEQQGSVDRLAADDARPLLEPLQQRLERLAAQIDRAKQGDPALDERLHGESPRRDPEVVE